MSRKNKEIPEAQAEEVKVEAESEAVTEIPKEEEVKPEAPKENLMYVGDTIPGVVRHSTVYADGILTPVIDKCIEADPQMAQLFVKIDDIPDALKLVKKEYSPLYVINKEAASKFTRRK